MKSLFRRERERPNRIAWANHENKDKEKNGFKYSLFLVAAGKKKAIY